MLRPSILFLPVVTNNVQIYHQTEYLLQCMTSILLRHNCIYGFSTETCLDKVEEVTNPEFPLFLIHVFKYLIVQYVQVLFSLLKTKNKHILQADALDQHLLSILLLDWQTYQQTFSFQCGPRANGNFPLFFSYLSDSKDQTTIEKVLLANDRGN